MEAKTSAKRPISNVRGCVVESVGKVQNTVTPELVARMVELYEGGATAREVGKAAGLHSDTVMRHLWKAGAKLRRHGFDDT